MFIKWSSLHKSVSKFTPKKFYEIDPRFAEHPSQILTGQQSVTQSIIRSGMNLVTPKAALIYLAKLQHICERLKPFKLL